MKFDSSALPLLPTQQELTELNDLLLSTMELYQTYATLERHPRVIGAPRSVELFTSCREQLHQDISLLDKQLEILSSLSRATVDDESKSAGDENAAVVHTGGGDGPHPLLLIPGVEPIDMNQSVFEIMRKAFHTEDLFSDQLVASLRSAQNRKHLKLELQLKMIILSADQRTKLLVDRYGYAKTK